MRTERERTAESGRSRKPDGARRRAKERGGRGGFTVDVLLPHPLQIHLGPERLPHGGQAAAPRQPLGDLVVLVEVVLGEPGLDAGVRVAGVGDAEQAAAADARVDAAGAGAPLALEAQHLGRARDAHLGAGQVHEHAQARREAAARVRDRGRVVGDQGAELGAGLQVRLETRRCRVAECCRAPRRRCVSACLCVG